MAQRLAYRRRLSYNTSSNKTRKVRAPKGRLVLQYVKKRGRAPRCGDCGTVLAGIKLMRSSELSRVPSSKKTVTRPYGGSRCANCVKTRITRAFLVEERKIATRSFKLNKSKCLTKK